MATVRCRSRRTLKRISFMTMRKPLDLAALSSTILTSRSTPVTKQICLMRKTVPRTPFNKVSDADPLDTPSRQKLIRQLTEEREKRDAGDESDENYESDGGDESDERDALERRLRRAASNSEAPETPIAEIREVQENDDRKDRGLEHD